MGMNYYDASNDNNMRVECIYNNSRLAVLAGPLFFDSRLIKWGKLRSVETYDSKGRLLKSTSYEYNDVSNRPKYRQPESMNNPNDGNLIGEELEAEDTYSLPLRAKGALQTVADSPLGCTDVIVMFSHYNGANISKKLFVYPDVITKEVTKEYNEGNNSPIETVRRYYHDRKLRLKTETINDSRNKQYFTRYTYPDELELTSNTSDKPALCMLVDSNQINVPVETVSGFVKDGSDYITSGKINLYNVGTGERKVPMTYKDLQSQALRSPAISGSITIPDRWEYVYKTIEVTYPYLYQTMSLAITSPIENYKKMEANGNNVTFDSRYKLDTEYKFDAMNRLTSIKPFGQMETKYTWNGIYPTSKTFGNQTWKYSFIPHVGVKQITDPRGINTYYTYDSNGRLIEEYTKDENGNKQILNVYQYHIKSEK